MKKLFTLMAAALFAVGASAQTVLIDFPTSKDGITLVEGGTASFATVKIHANTDAVDCVKFGNSGLNNGVTLSVDGGFKAGDKIEIAGAISAGSDEKSARVDIYAKTAGAYPEAATFSTQNFIDAKVSADEPVVETFVLEADAEDLCLARQGNTGANVTLLKITREATAGGGDEPGEGGDAAETVVIWEGEEVYDGSWGFLGHYGTGDSFKDAKVGDMIRCTVTAAGEGWNPVFKNSSWQDLAGVEETKKVYENYFEGTISTEDALTYLKENGLYLQGVLFTLVKVELIKFAGGEDGINVVKTQAENGAIYNLAGQKVDKNYKGIVIMNGKKYMQK